MAGELKEKQGKYLSLSILSGSISGLSNVASPDKETVTNPFLGVIPNP